ncbi:Macrolide export ATP-binding/permease protein MacB [Varanus komodoensis]|nr:Macrolide export ATP-binding/permease protein MacB [Varanus komodoensis]
MNKYNLTVGVPFQQQQPSVSLHTDASLMGWRAHCANLLTQGTWQAHKKTEHINILELLAVFKALRSFEPTLLNRSIQVASYNVVTVFYINKQGGTKSVLLAHLALQIWKWCIPRGITLLMVHLAGVDNEEADTLSRKMSSTHKWELDDRICRDLFTRWGTPSLDLFATAINLKCRTYCSRAGRGPNLLGNAMMPEITFILQSALRPSTHRSYENKWKCFTAFAETNQFPPHSASIENILSFLLSLHQDGLKPTSIRVNRHCAGAAPIMCECTDDHSKNDSDRYKLDLTFKAQEFYEKFGSRLQEEEPGASKEGGIDVELMELTTYHSDLEQEVQTPEVDTDLQQEVQILKTEEERRATPPPCPSADDATLPEGKCFSKSQKQKEKRKHSESDKSLGHKKPKKDRADKIAHKTKKANQP